MSPSVFIVKRTTAAGAVRWQVRYRLGGREARPMSGGTFPTKREAEARQRWIAGEIAAMRAPDLHALEAPAEVLTLAAAIEEMETGRIDVGDAARNQYRKARQRLGELGERDVLTIRPAHINAWIREIAGELAPATVASYVSVVRQALDELPDGRPNAARAKSVKLPRVVDSGVAPPSYADYMAIAREISSKYRFAVELIERTGLRISEAAALTWGDVDLAGRRLRVPWGGKTNAARRFIPLVEDWPERIADSCPLEDRAPGRLVLGGLTDSGVRRALAIACRNAGVAHYSPHELRHRHISLMVLAGIPMPLVIQISGHAKQSTTHDTYSHVLLDEPAWRLAALRRGVLVVSGWAAEDPSQKESPANRDPAGEMGSTGILPPRPHE